MSPAGQRLRLLGLVRKPMPHDQCIVARTTGVAARVAVDSPLLMASPPAVTPAAYAAGTIQAGGQTNPAIVAAVVAPTIVGGAR